MIHRYLAIFISFLLFIQTIYVWIDYIKNFNLKISPLYITGSFIFICIQCIFGAWTVTSKLNPIIVTIHLLFGLILLTILNYCYILYNKKSINVKKKHNLKTITTLCLILLILQVILGGLVSSTHSSLICTNFYKCFNYIKKNTNYNNIFNLFYLYNIQNKYYINNKYSLTIINLIHSLFSIIIVPNILTLIFKLYYIKSMRIFYINILILTILQFITGILNNSFKLYLLIALLHSSISSILIPTIAIIIII